MASGSSSAASSVGCEVIHSASDRISWARAVQLCHDSNIKADELVRNASSSADLDRLDIMTGSSPRERDFLAACAVNLSLCGSKSFLAQRPAHVLQCLARQYAWVALSRPHHEAFLGALIAHGERVDLSLIFQLVLDGVHASWPGADPDRAGCRQWFTNHTALLRAVYLTARELLLPNSSTSHERLPGGVDAVTAALPLVEAVLEHINVDLVSCDLTQLRRNPGYVQCLAQTLSMSSVVDPTTLSEALTALLNDCFARCTTGLPTLLSHEHGLPVVRALVDDLARGVKARRYVQDRIVEFCMDAIAKHAVIYTLDHAAKVSSRIGSEMMQPAPPALAAQALTCAAELPPTAPTICALACHPEATKVVPVLLEYADGFYAVAMAEALHRHADALRHSVVPDAAAAAAWAADHPRLTTAVVATHTKLGRDLVVQREAISEPTAALRSIESALEAMAAGGPDAPIPPPHKFTAKLCVTFAETGACHNGVKCAHLHVDGAVVAQHTDRDCCCEHGSPDYCTATSAAVTVDIASPLQLVDSRDHQRPMPELTVRQFGFTAGLGLYLARDYDVGIPLETDSLCRQHLRGGCHKPLQCKYVHLCRKAHAALTATTALPTPAPAAVTTTSNSNVAADGHEALPNEVANPATAGRATPPAAAGGTGPRGGGARRPPSSTATSEPQTPHQQQQQGPAAGFSKSRRQRHATVAADASLLALSGSGVLLGAPSWSSPHPHRAAGVQTPSLHSSNGAAPRPFVTHAGPMQPSGFQPHAQQAQPRLHERQQSGFTATTASQGGYSDVSESPLAAAFSQRRRGSHPHQQQPQQQQPQQQQQQQQQASPPSRNGTNGSSMRSVGPGSSGGGHGSGQGLFGGAALSFGPGHGTPGESCYDGATTPTTNRSVPRR